MFLIIVNDVISHKDIKNSSKFRYISKIEDTAFCITRFEFAPRTYLHRV